MSEDKREPVPVNSCIDYFDKEDMRPWHVRKWEELVTWPSRFIWNLKLNYVIKPGVKAGYLKFYWNGVEVNWVSVPVFEMPEKSDIKFSEIKDRRFALIDRAQQENKIDTSDVSDEEVFEVIRSEAEEIKCAENIFIWRN